ncbi:MAG: MFS transporter [Cyanobacteria bacterium P01_H01_bin.119]
MGSSPAENQPAFSEALTFKTRLSYGIGELAGALPTSANAFLLLFFLTNVAGLAPSLAGAVILVSKVWDAVSDPVIGWLSDRTRSSLGRRYPWMLAGAVPLGLLTMIQWWLPPTNQQWLLFTYYATAGVLAFTAFTAVQLPFSALAAELTQGYDARISLISFKSGFSIVGSIFTLVLARIIFEQVDNPAFQYITLGGINGTLVIVAILLCVLGTLPRYRAARRRHPEVGVVTSTSLIKQIGVATQSRPFLLVIGLYLCSWTGVQVTAVVLPYFVVDWMGLSEQYFIQMALVVQGTAVTTMYGWNMIGRRTGKRSIYFMGIPVTLIGLVGLFFIQPGQVGAMYGLGFLAGIGVATVYLVPWSMLPDVVDLDELTTGKRREGIFYGFVVFLQKIGIALAVFITGRILDWAGFIPSVAGEPSPVQPDSALWAIRMIMGPLPVITLLLGLLFAYWYPISREVHAEILLKLKARHSSDD